MKENQLVKVLLVSVIIFFLCMTFLSCLYGYYFFLLPTSAAGEAKDMAVWGQLGDYLGGLLNPIIGFVGLLISLYLAYQVSLIAENTIKADRKNVILQLQYDLYLRFRERMNHAILGFGGDIRKAEQANLIRVEKLRFNLELYLLFPNLENDDSNIAFEEIMIQIDSDCNSFRRGAPETPTIIMRIDRSFDELRIAYEEFLRKIGARLVG